METQKTRDIFGILIKIGILVITGYKTIDLMMSTLPEGQKWIGLSAVFTVDIALLYWDHYMGDPKLAKCREQRWVGAIGIIANMIAITVIMIADSANYVAKQQFNDVIIIGSVIGLALIAVINLSLAVAGHQFDPDRELAEKEAHHQRETALLLKQHEQDMALGRLMHQLASEKLQQDSDLEIDRLSHNKKVQDTKDTFTRGTRPLAAQPAQEDESIVNRLKAALGVNGDEPANARSMAANGNGQPPKVKEG